MNAKYFLLNSNYWVIPKFLVKELGLETTLILSCLADGEQIFNPVDGWFFQTQETIEEETGLSRHKQDKAINDLMARGLITKELRDSPPKRYFKFNDLAINEMVANAHYVKNQQLEVLKIDNNKESINKESIKDSMADAKEHDGFLKVIEFYKGKTLPKYTKITPKRKSMVNARIKEYSVDTVLNGLDMASKSEFLNKPENKSWYNFDWIFNPNNFVKILEGKYNRVEPKAKTETQEFLERLKKGGKK
jgi:hypothetical protein